MVKEIGMTPGRFCFEDRCHWLMQIEVASNLLSKIYENSWVSLSYEAQLSGAYHIRMNSSTRMTGRDGGLRETVIRPNFSQLQMR